MKKTIILFSLVILALIVAGCTQYAGGNDKNPPTIAAKSPEIVELEDGGSYTITASQVLKNIDGKEYPMYAYNEMTPGPTLKVSQGSRVKIMFVNNIDHDTTIHWHGLRQNIKDDGVPDVSQKPVKKGESYTYNLYFPDDGIYWYHPHIREDEQQDLGLAGNIIVTPKSINYNPVNREEVVMLDDILMDEQGIVPYPKNDANFALMGRFGNVMLVNGKVDYSLNVQKGDVVRFYFTDASNTRPFNISIPGVRMKLVGSDGGLYEKETYIDSVIITPGERYIIEAYFEKDGEYNLMNINPIRKYDLGKISVSSKSSDNDFSKEFDILRSNGKLLDTTEYLSKDPDYSLRLVIDSGMMMNGRMGGMMNMGENFDSPIEWEDSMRMMNYHSTASNTKWTIRDEKTGKENMDFEMNAKVGGKVKIRIFNDPNSMHPMQHPIHLHGQRFLVLSVDGEPVDNQVWKDTTLLPIGSTMDILVEVTNPGEWMLHCHIAEHLESGMMTKFIVT
jgi:FtsP/CotA-like multicopper oxidase with cupredoxin domain